MGNARPARRKIGRRLAADDGRTLSVQACCKLEITLGATHIKVAHDDWCAVLTDPYSPAGVTARLHADRAVAAVLDADGYGPVTLVVGT